MTAASSMFPTSARAPQWSAAPSSLSLSEGSETRSAADINDVDLFMPSVETPPPAQPATPARPRSHYGLSYKLKQYSTDALIAGGILTTVCLLAFPLPTLTALLGASLGVACVLAGAALKHYFYRVASRSEALPKTVGKLTQNVRQLKSDIHHLDHTRKELQATAVSLGNIREDLQGEVATLQTQLDHLDKEINEGFLQLNEDRSHFEQEKNTLLRHLADEISEADERGDRAQEKLDRINQREDKQREFQAELETRRQALLADETSLASLQERLLARFSRHTGGASLEPQQKRSI